MALRLADSGADILIDAIAYFDCEVTRMAEPGDHTHTVNIGQVDGLALDFPGGVSASSFG